MSDQSDTNLAVESLEPADRTATRTGRSWVIFAACGAGCGLPSVVLRGLLSPVK